MNFFHYIKSLTSYANHIFWFLFLVFTGYLVASLCLVGTAAWFEWITEMIGENLDFANTSAAVKANVAQPTDQLVNPFEDSGIANILPDTQGVFTWLSGISSSFWVSSTVVFFLFFRGMGELLATYASKRISMDMAAGLRSHMFRISMSLPYSVFDKSIGSVIFSRIIYTCPKVTNAFAILLTDLIRHSLQFFTLLIYMLWLSYILTGLLFIITPLVIIALYYVSKIIREHSRNQQRSFNNVSKVIDETVTGYKMVKVYQGESKQQALFDNMNLFHEKSSYSVAMITALISPLVVTSGAVVLALIAYGAANGWLVDFNAGRVMSFFISTTLMFNSVRNIISLNTKYQEFMAASEEVFNHLALDTEKNNSGMVTPSVLGDIEIKNLCFSYDGKNNVIHDLNLQIKQGQMVCFAGINGSGKSTMLNLLSRFFEPTAGKIEIAGINISDYSLQSFRSQISMVTQDVFIFDDTIRNNITFGAVNASEADVINAAKQSDAHDFIMNLSDGYDTFVGRNGTLLSGGQRQKISLCRAMVKKSSILFIDEATSALDAKAEIEIINNLRNLPHNPTIIAVSHREEQLQNADIIFVMDRGKLVESGSHNDLKQQQASVYANLYNLSTDSIPDAAPNSIDWESELQSRIPIDKIQLNIEAPDVNSLEKKLNKTWYNEKSITSLALLPFSWFINLLVLVRRFLYFINLFKSVKFPLPIVVVGNINVGGSGKTPMVIALVEHLQSMGLRVGVACNGYGSKAKFYPQFVTQSSKAHEMGDEAVLIYEKTQAIIAVAENRMQACELLCHSEIDVIVCDDGLQDYRIHRDIELVMFDANLGFGNRRILPAGPLREPLSRVSKADFLIYKNTQNIDKDRIKLPVQMHGIAHQFLYEPADLINVETKQTMKVNEWPKSIVVQAVAAIAHPEFFFLTLKNLGIVSQNLPFPDHHNFKAEDFDFVKDRPIIVTEKDAVKCQSFEDKRIWALRMTGKLSVDFWRQFDEKYNSILKRSTEK